MSNFESIFIPFENTPALQQSRRSRLKMGDIFHCGTNLYALVCIHCSMEFTNFTTFTSHVQIHLMDVCSQASKAPPKLKQDIKYETKYEVNLNASFIDENSTNHFDTFSPTPKIENDLNESDAENDSIDNVEVKFKDENSDDSADDNDEMSQCPLCAKNFNTLNGLQTHLQDDHKRMYPTGTIELVDKPPKGVEVKKSNEKVTASSRNSKEEYLNVQKKVRGEGFELDDSPQAFEFFKYIYDFTDMNADTIDLFQCPKCSHMCKKMSKMRTHIFKHLEETIFVCIECKRSFNRVGAIRQHVKKMHPTETHKKASLSRKTASERIGHSGGRDDTKKFKSTREIATNKSSRKLRARNATSTKSKATYSESSSESSSSSDDDSVYEPKAAIESDECTDNDNADIETVPDVDLAELSDNLEEDDEQKEIMLTSDDFQQHTKAQERFKQKYIEINDTPVAIEYAKYVLMTDYKVSDTFFQCPKCPYSCTKFPEMRRHIFTHLKQKIFTCMFCKRKSNRLNRMEWHVADHVKNNSKKLFERLNEMNCNNKTIDQNDANDNSTNGKIDKQLAIVRKRLNVHCIQLENSDEGIKYAQYYLLHGVKLIDGHFQCPQCHAFIISRNSIRKHLFRHIKTEIFSCMICNEKAAAYDLIRKHMKQKHLKRINEVDVDAGTESSMPIKDEYTVEEMDTDISTIKDKQRVLCTICGTSVKANGLKKHINIHERKADFKCNLCDKSFLRKCKLLEHRRSHPEPMPYHCGICSKGYILKKGLVRHLATHGRET